MNIQWVGCHPNNYQSGRQGKQIKYIICHWIVGTLESADATFQNPNRIASATYGVGDTDIHQYVKEEDTAYANGNFTSNLESISIEHEGGPDIPITNATYETSAQLIASISKKYGIPLDRSRIRKHNEVSDKATQCPGTLDLDRLINRAKEILTPAQPAFTNQTKIPLNVVTQLESYGEKELQAIRSDYIDKDAQIKDAREKQKTIDNQAKVIESYQIQAEKLNIDLDKLKKDLEKYKKQEEARGEEEVIKTYPQPPKTPPQTAPNPQPTPSIIAKFIEWLHRPWH